VKEIEGGEEELRVMADTHLTVMTRTEMMILDAMEIVGESILHVVHDESVQSRVVSEV
jgi:hypothetical protein